MPTILRKSLRRWRLLAAPIIGAAALLLPMAAPAGAVNSVPETVGAGVATGLVQGNGPTTFACTAPTGYSFFGVNISGAFLGHGDIPAVNSTGFNPLPSAPATAVTGDPLNGTPLGCHGAGSAVPELAPLLTNGTSPVIPAGTALLGCPVVNTCPGGPGWSNALADEGQVLGAGGATAFVCDFPGPGFNAVRCTLSGTFVRYGNLVLVFLTGCVDTAFLRGTCTSNDGSSPVPPNPHSEDVVLAALIVPVPATNPACTTIPGPFDCSFLTGPFVVTPHNTPPLPQAALDALYCPLAPVLATHTPNGHPPVSNCL